jgi:hypothetical protein
MDFTVYKDGELSDVPNGYYEIPGSMRIIEPGKVEWWLMVQDLAHHDYKGNADLYYIEPGCVPPNGMVLMEGPEHVEQMMQALKGRKTCELYIIRNGPPSVDSYDYDGMIEEVAHVANFLHIVYSSSLHYFYTDCNTFLCFTTGSDQRSCMGG